MHQKENSHLLQEGPILEENRRREVRNPAFLYTGTRKAILGAAMSFFEVHPCDVFLRSSSLPGRPGATKPVSEAPSSGACHRNGGCTALSRPTFLCWMSVVFRWRNNPIRVLSSFFPSCKSWLVNCSFPTYYIRSQLTALPS